MKVADACAVQMTEQIQAMNNMLKTMSKASMGLDEKMMKAAATAKITGLGENFDQYM